MKLLTRAWIVIALCCAAGCMSSDLLITIRADGSGMIRHTIKINNAAMAAFNSPPGLPAGAAPTPAREQFTEQQAASAARSFGPNVHIMSSRSISTAQIEGRTSVYTFEKVSDLSVDLLPMLPGMHGTLFGFDAQPVGPLATQLRFALTTAENGNALLTVKFPEARFDPSAPMEEKPHQNSPEELAWLRQVLRNARVLIQVQPATPLLRTNSPLREDNRVVLLDLDIEKIALSDEVDKLFTSRPASLDELRWALHDLPGAKIALDRDITLEFEGLPQAPPLPPAAPGQAPPDSEIYLAPLSRAAGRLTVGPAVNITNSKGYDNQPAFTPDGRAIFFTSVRGSTAPPASGTAVQTDIYRYDIDSRATTRITNTPESEYSPTITPDGAHISVVRVEPDGIQRLWRFTLDGRDPELVLHDVKPVGYHAWAGDHSVALFVLGDPATLQLADTTTGKTQIVATSVGRSLQRTPSGTISYIQRAAAAGGAAAPNVMELDPQTGSVKILVRVLAGETEPYLAWMPDGTLLLAHDGTLYQWQRGASDWTPAADLLKLGLRGATRLAVSPRGDWLALVAEPR